MLPAPLHKGRLSGMQIYLVAIERETARSEVAVK